ncbi:hypothetical protein TKK_0012365 [Trichogramma kaykai]|uniref:LRRCT domain-containing protein n=1 Tax=Trichogramma kaykai TaxID=54128 RepID=A0ABD2WN88_9HYME
MADLGQSLPADKTSGKTGRKNGSVSALLLVSLLLVLRVPEARAGLCPSICKCDDDTLSSSCAYAGLDIVPIQLNPGLRQLDLSGNRISSLHRTFDFYGNLASLDLSSNLVHTLGANNFQSNGHMVSLNLSSNALSTLAKNALHGLKMLRELDLSSNNISDLDPQAFRYTTELERLDLSGNSLTSLPDDLLRNLHKIRVLALKGNSLLEVPSPNLALAPSLEFLDLSDNLIQELGGSVAVPSLPALATLSLANNVLRSLADDSFERLPGLRSLDLSGNNLTYVPTGALARLAVLDTLLLTRNPLGGLRDLAFRSLFELRSLELEDCSINFVEARAFADNVNLERISLDGNRELNELPARVLYAAGNLRWVSLRRCSLGSLQPTQFPVDGLQTLRVGGNPLMCNCSVHWLWNVLRDEEQRRNLSDGGSRLEIDSAEIICADEEFAGKALLRLPEGSLRCRLSPLYLALSVAGCLLATIGILALVAYVTRMKRRKRVPTYAAPTHPELLVYVGRANDGLPEKHHESYSRRLIARTEDLVYEAANQDYQRSGSSSGRKSGSESPDSRETNVYETPRYSRPSPAPRSNGFNSFYQQQIQAGAPPPPPLSTNHLSSSSSSQHSPYATANEMLYGEKQQPASLAVANGNCLQPQEGVYAVADVTNYHEDPSTLYRMQRQQRQQQHRHPYEYSEYEYEPPLPPKPHVVFV